MTAGGDARRRRWFLVIVAGALLLRLGAFVMTDARNPASMMSPDSYRYQRLGRTLLDEGRFAGGAGGRAHTRRTPLFPALIAAVYFTVGQEFRAVVLLGILLSSLTAGLALLAAWRLGGETAGVAAGVLLAMDTASIAACLRLLTEAPFTALLAAGTVAAWAGALDPRPRPVRASLLGALLAAAALTRPIGLFLIFPVGLWLVLCARKQHWSRAATISMLAAFALPWVVMVGAWQVRNRVAAGSYAASAGPAKFLPLSRGADIIAQRDGIEFGEARAELVRTIAETARRTGAREETLYLRPALALIARHPLLFLRTQVRWLPELMLGTGAAPLAGSMGLDAAGDRTAKAAARVLLAWSLLHLLVVYVAFGWALWTVRREPGERQLAMAFLAGLTLYFVILSTGPQGYSRLRAPVMPLLAMGAGLGLESAWRRRCPAA